MSETVPESVEETVEGQLVEAQAAAPPEAGEVGVTGGNTPRPRPKV